MKNRIFKKSSKNLDQLRTFFLACEFKPHSDLFSIIDPFAYDIKPAYIHGSLGIISYEPITYAIIDTEEQSSPLVGYIMTITHPDTILLLDKIKGVFGPDSFGFHTRKLVHAFTDIKVVRNAWCYVLSERVLENFEQVEQIEFGLWQNDDETLVDFLEKIGEV